MAEKKSEESTMETQIEAPKPTDTTSKPSTTTVIIQSPATSSMLTKAPPNDLYRRLLPAVLFVLTFVTVMTMLLIYMDTVALGAAQFRVNMSRDYELSDIGAESPELVSYVRQLHLRESPPATESPTDSDTVTPTPTIAVLDTVFPADYVGRFAVVYGSGPRPSTSQFLSRVRGWWGLEVRADPRAYLALAGHVAALHACLSHTHHPREVSVRGEAGFVGRVLCLPLVTILRAGDLTNADLLLLRGHDGLTALTHLPFMSTSVKVIELESSDASILNSTTTLLTAHNYTLLANLQHSNIYKLNNI